jgi:hypothetical protein
LAAKRGVENAADPTQEATRQDERNFASELLVLGGGIVTSVATALGVFLFQQYSGDDVSSFMVWFIIPVGSGLCGFAAASGYYLASRYTGVPATRLLAVNMTLIGLSTYALIQLLNYYGTSVADVPVSRLVSFWTYYRSSIESTQLVSMGAGIHTEPSEPLGTAGYWYELVRILGFLVGGLVVWFQLSEAPYCPECHRYYRRTVLLDTPKSEDIDEFVAKSGLTFPDLIGAFSSKMKSHRPTTFYVHLYSCGSCDRKIIRFSFSSGRDNIIEVKRYTYRGNFQSTKTS